MYHFNFTLYGSVRKLEDAASTVTGIEAFKTGTAEPAVDGFAADIVSTVAGEVPISITYRLAGGGATLTDTDNAAPWLNVTLEAMQGPDTISIEAVVEDSLGTHVDGPFDLVIEEAPEFSLEDMPGFVALWDPAVAVKTGGAPAEDGDPIRDVQSDPSGYLASGQGTWPVLRTNVLDGHPVMEFDPAGSNWFSVNDFAPVMAASDGMTFYFIAKADADHTGALISAHGASGNTNRLILWHLLDADTGTVGNQPGIGLIVNGAVGINQNAVCPQTNWSVYALRVNLTTGETKLIQDETVLMTPSGTTLDWSDVGRVSFGQEYDTSSASDYFDGRMGRIVAYNEAHSDEDMATVVDILQDYYSIGDLTFNGDPLDFDGDPLFFN